MTINLGQSKYARSTGQGWTADSDYNHLCQWKQWIACGPWISKRVESISWETARQPLLPSFLDALVRPRQRPAPSDDSGSDDVDDILADTGTGETKLRLFTSAADGKHARAFLKEIRDGNL